MIACTFSRVSSRTSGESLIKRDTVFFETLASRAISLIVTLPGLPPPAPRGASPAAMAAGARRLPLFVTPYPLVNSGAGRAAAGVEGLRRARRHRLQLP